VSLPSSYRSRRGHIHLLRVLPLVGCRSKTPTVLSFICSRFMKRLCLKVESKREHIIEENWFLKTIVLLRCESVAVTPDPTSSYVC
jgi:hypothetical protein